MDLEDWIARWSKRGSVIEDEYGRRVKPSEMLNIITERSHPVPWSRKFEGSVRVSYRDEDDFHRSNYSERGPNNLLRHRVGVACQKHGAGTWDCVEGDFC